MAPAAETEAEVEFAWRDLSLDLSPTAKLHRVEIDVGAVHPPGTERRTLANVKPGPFPSGY